LLFVFCSTGAWIQGLHLEPLHQPYFFFFFWWRVFWDRVSQTICPGWLWTVVLLISASWVARITGVRHQHPAIIDFLLPQSYRTLTSGS
jgi:hypothetical protein